MQILIPLLVLLVVLLIVGGVVLVSRGGGDPDVPESDAIGSGTGGVAVAEPPVAEVDGVGLAEPGVAEPPVAEPGAAEAGVAEPEVAEPQVEEPDLAEPDLEELVRPRFRDRLGKARAALSGYVGSVLSRSEITEESYEELEEALILADVGVAHTAEILDAVRATVKEQKLTTSEELVDVLKQELRSRLGDVPPLATSDTSPSIWLFVGVNGVGKTTTIGKVGHRLASEQATVVMAAGDTFRAAAAEQLETWADRCGATLVRGAEGGDPSSVIFDAVESAAARSADFVLADTAGRLHTKTNLMDELAKVRRVADRGAGSVSEVLLVIDATTGQNGLTQARQFAEATDVTGVVLTKLDGSAKGGIVFAIRSELGLPVKLVGLGETAADLVDFDPEEFVGALFDQD
jgi:fused signal recognition particle receptor